jgi:hypothetical protein
MLARALRVKAVAVRMVEKSLLKAPAPWQTLKAAAAFAAAFGTLNNERHSVERKHWDEAEHMAHEEGDLIARLWREVRPVLKSRIRMFDVSSCGPRYDEALRIAELIGLDQAALLEDAENAVPGKAPKPSGDLDIGKAKRANAKARRKEDL